MKFVPSEGHVLVKRDELEERISPAGIVIPNKTGKRPDTATVLALPVKCPAPISVGDKVVISRFCGIEVVWGDGEEGAVVALRDILGTIE